MRESGYTLVTGGAGFIGSNLAHVLLRRGERVVLADNLSRSGVELNAAWLTEQHGSRVELTQVDVSRREQIAPLVTRAKRVYHLAAQVAVTTSIQDPRDDLDTNLLGTFHILEAARACSRPPPVLFTSTNKVYGSLEELAIELKDEKYRYCGPLQGIDESTRLDFSSPYGCSKGAADQYVRDYARMYGLPTVVFRMSCIYGTRQFGTEDQGWVAHFGRSILNGSPLTIYGDGYQVRDILWVGDLVRAMIAATDRIDKTAGAVLNIGGGPENAVSVREVIEELVDISGREVAMTPGPWRPGDQRIYVSDTSRAQRLLGWRPEMSWRSGLTKLVDWLTAFEAGEPTLIPPARSDSPTRTLERVAS